MLTFLPCHFQDRHELHWGIARWCYPYAQVMLHLKMYANWLERKEHHHPQMEKIGLTLPISVSWVFQAYLIKVLHQGKTAVALQFLQLQKFFFCHNVKNSCSYGHYCECKGHTLLQLLQRVFCRMLTYQIVLHPLLPTNSRYYQVQPDSNG